MKEIGKRSTTEFGLMNLQTNLKMSSFIQTLSLSRTLVNTLHNNSKGGLLLKSPENTDSISLAMIGVDFALERLQIKLQIIRIFLMLIVKLTTEITIETLKITERESLTGLNLSKESITTLRPTLRTTTATKISLFPLKLNKTLSQNITMQ